MKLKKIKKTIINNFKSFFVTSIVSIGVILSSIYILKIGYLPEIESASSILMFFIFTIVGISLIVFLSAIIVGPGLFWLFSLYNSKNFKSLWTDKSNEHNKRKVSLLFLMMLIAGYSAIYMALNQHWLLSSIIICSLVTTAFFVTKSLLGKSIMQSTFATIELLWTSFVCLILGLFPVVFIIGQLENKVPSYSFEIEMIFFGIMSIIAMFNIMITMKPSHIKVAYWATGFSLLSFAIVSSMLSDITIVPAKTAKALKIGNFTAQSIAINNSMCKKFIADQLALGDHDNCVIEEPFILSKVGKNIYFEKDDLRYEIDKQYITSKVIPR